MTDISHENAEGEDIVVTEDWASLSKGQSFITDLGFEPNYLLPMPGGPPMMLGRYAVFLPLPEDDTRHQIVEASHDLDYLKTKYSIGDEMVLNIINKAA